MEIFLRFVATLVNLIGILLYPFTVFFASYKPKKLPPIESDLVNIPVVDLAEKIRNQQLKSEDVVRAYIQRIQDVNHAINAVIQERFISAILDAKRADEICSKTSPTEIAIRYPLLGIPFTVKECCSVKGMLYTIGSVPRNQMKATHDGEVVERMKAAGAIPLLVSANPEFCFSWETHSLLFGTCKNPYDLRRSAGGSSGGEGALNGAGASPFGIGSDFAGSIRVPSLFNGIFGHKPTGGLVSTKGHFPSSMDPNFPNYLQIGPMTRFARDLPILMQVMAGDNSHKLGLDKNVFTKDIKIYYLSDNGFTFTHTPIDADIQLSILKAVEHFKQNGLVTQWASSIDLSEQMEIVISAYLEMTDKPDMLAHPNNPKKTDNILAELAKHVITSPKYTFAALFFVFLQKTNGFMSAETRKMFVEKGNVLKQQIADVLGDNGVLFYPTFHCPAYYHKTSTVNFGGVPYCSLFNILGLPATHVPMGLGKNGLPTGFQVVAAPYQDKLCFTIAGELEAAFGGWVPPPSESKTDCVSAKM